MSQDEVHNGIFMRTTTLMKKNSLQHRALYQ